MRCESQRLQQNSCRLRSTDSKKANPQTATEFRAEDIKACDDETREMVRQMFNEIANQNEFTPEAWEKVSIKVIHKKGDVEDVGNYRPICSLPALYKLFTTILYSRLYPRLDQIQAEDQAGFRSSNQTKDDLATYRMIDQKCHEWVDQNVDCDNRLHEGVRRRHTQINLERPHILRYRTRLHQPPEEVFQRPESICTD